MTSAVKEGGPEMRLTVSTNAALGMTANNNSTSFWRVTAVRPGSQAERLGIRVGYYISSIGGRKLTADENLENIMRDVKSSADTYELIILRQLSKEEPAVGGNDDSSNDHGEDLDENEKREHVGNGSVNSSHVPEVTSGTRTQRGRAVGSNSTSVPAPKTPSPENLAQCNRMVGSCVGNSSEPDVSSERNARKAPGSDNENLSDVRQSKEGKRRSNVITLPPQPTRRSSGTMDSSEASDPIKWQLRKAVIPTAKGADVTLYGDIYEICEERVKKVCNEYCLLPPGRRHLLTAAMNLVFSSLCYDAPKRLAENNDSEHHWILGLKPHLNGPQPWMLTRKFIVQRVEDMLEADEIDWLASNERKEELLGKQIPIIKRFLITWKPRLESTSQLAVLEKYATNIYKRFALDHFAGGDMNVLHKLTESYVHVVAAKLEQKKMCPPVPGKAVTGASSQTAPQLDASIMTKLTEMRFDIVPFVKDLPQVKDSVLGRLKTNFVRLEGIHVSKSLIRSILDDLEVDSNYLSMCNELLKVRVRISGLDSSNRKQLAHDFIGNGDISSEEDDMKASEELQAVEHGDGSSHLEQKESAAKAALASDEGTSDEEDDKARKYSSSRVLGARVYAEFTNGDYYWGSIASITQNKKTQEKKFTVHFEDGDILESIPSTNIFTETEYIDIFEAEPPEPAFVSSRDRRRSLRESNLSERRKKGRVGRKSRRQSSPAEEQPKPKEMERKRSRRIMNDEDPGETSTKKRRTRTGAATLKEPEHEKQAGSSKREPEFIPPSNIIENIREGCLTPRELRKRRCKKCVLCKRSDCGQCSTCLRNRSIQKGSSKGGKEVCLRKMCCNIPLEKKALPALGFSPGWAFAFEEPKSTFRSIDAVSTFPGLSIFAPDDRKFGSIENAAIHDGTATIDFETICQQFRAHIGASSYQSDPDHFLVGKGFCHEWINVEGRNRVLFGTIASCAKDTTENGDTHFVVEYSDESRSLLNAASNGFGRNIPSSEELLSAAAWGGCVSFERKTHIRRGPGSVVKSVDRTIPCESWVTPDFREEISPESGQGALPGLVIAFRGFKLSFCVKESTIPGAGLGVFCRCTSLTNNASSRASDSNWMEPFDLKAGEMLDLGVYAPFRAEDKKHRCVFHVKNYIFSMSCEDWCFNSPDAEYQYDITDDTTGDLHDIGRSHIMTFVNECGQNSCPNIYARLDPEGGVHYLMGVAYHGDFNDYEQAMKHLELRAGGKEIELFVDYGEAYENVRVRKGYSSLGEKQKTERLALIKQTEKAFVLEISQYSWEDVSRTVEFLLHKFCPAEDEKISGKVRDRALEVSWRLRARVQELENDKNAPGPARSRKSELDQFVASLDELNERLCALRCDRKPPDDLGKAFFSEGGKEHIIMDDEHEDRSGDESDTSYEYTPPDSSSEESGA